jgi:glycosyltransferase involved in cell wall biosynthesis
MVNYFCNISIICFFHCFLNNSGGITDNQIANFYLMVLSIITVNLNNELGLRKTIDSVIKQFFTDYEYIIIDGGSTDGSVAVVKEYADKLTYWVSEPDKGIYNAMNKGIIHANGEYLMFLNSGDFLCDNSVLYNVFNEKLTGDIISGNTILQDRNLKFTYRSAPDRYGLVEALNNSLAHSCSFHKRTLFINFGLYNENRKIASDWEFSLKAIIKYGASYQKIQHYITVFNKEGISRTQISLNESERIDILNEIYPPEIVDFLIEYVPLKIFYDKISKNGLAQLGIYLSRVGFIRRPINKIYKMIKISK